MSDSGQIIIKKVKKVSGGGHHGGAWKVAYADFVTAMMAFFLLMWLLNATTEDQRKGVADYFNPTIPISQVSGGGSQVLNGASVFSEDKLIRDGSGGARGTQNTAETGDETGDETEKKKRKKEEAEKNAQEKALEALNESLQRKMSEGSGDGLEQHIKTKITPDGLVIEIVEIDGRPLFEVGSKKASKIMHLLMEAVANSLENVNNDIAIVGHTDSLAYSGRRDYSNWELSTDRANTARRLLIGSGFAAEKINRVAGKADTEPLLEDAFSPQNRRIAIAILK